MESHLSEMDTRKWSDLPQDVLTRIVRYLDPLTDLTRIRGVCPEWRSALPLSEFSTTRLTRVPSLKPISSKVFLVLTRFYFLSPITPSDDDRRGLGGNWVARISELPGPKRHFFNPFNLHNYFFPTPPLSASFNLLDSRVSELACVYTLFGNSGDGDAKPISKKVVGGWNLGSGSGCLFAVLAKLENGGGLVYWKAGDRKWTRMEITGSFRVMDIALHQGKFYLFELSGWRIGVIDPSITDSVSGMEFIPGPKILSEPINDTYMVSFNGKLYVLGDCHLISSNRKLYLVIVAILKANYMKPHKGNAFVYVLNENSVVWEHVSSLGDEIFFIGHDASFSLRNSSSNLPQWKPNSICMFTRPFPLFFDNSSKCGLVQKLPEGAECLDSVNYAEYWRYISLFDVEKQEKGLVPFRKLCRKTYTGLFFPPPAWVKWQCPSRGDVEVRLDGLEFSGCEEVSKLKCSGVTVHYYDEDGNELEVNSDTEEEEDDDNEEDEDGEQEDEDNDEET